MNILAYSGAIGRDCNVGTGELGWWNHGSSATLICDGNYIGSVSEERFTRFKNEGNFPVHSIKHLLSSAGIGLDDINIVAFATGASQPDAILLKNNYFQDELAKEFVNAEIVHVDHHLCHAACTFFSSGFESANVFTFDGAGDRHLLVGGHNTASFTNVENGRWLNLLTGYQYPDRKNKFHNQFLLGEFYHMVAFWCWDMIKKEMFAHKKQPRDTLDGKIMGLAAYGDAMKVAKHVSDPVSVSHVLPHFLPVITFCRETWSECERHFKHTAETIIRGGEGDYGPEDLAAWGQSIFENMVLSFLENIPEDYRLDNLCLSGGCALNILANSKIAASGLYKNVYIHPAPGDEGLCFGAAMWVANKLGIKVDLPHNIATVGPSYDDAHVEQVLASNDEINYTRVEDSELFDTVSQQLADNKIVAWHQGRSEYGPRALGNRSILANPTFDNKQLLNEKVKFREHWRPYAAIIMQDDVHDWVDLPRETSEYMLFASEVKEDKRSLVPAITHADNSCRVQTVTPQLNDKAYKLLQAFKQRTNIPMLLNTSFNTIPGEPIVETPYDAIKSFLYSDVDLLVINNFIVRKNGS